MAKDPSNTMMREKIKPGEFRNKSWTLAGHTKKWPKRALRTAGAYIIPLIMRVTG